MARERTECQNSGKKAGWQDGDEAGKENQKNIEAGS
jgi:hypothetical protein